jgi:iron uptake system component EfeO
MTRRSRAGITTAVLASAAALAGCTSTAPSAPPAGGTGAAAAPGPIAVRAADDACEVAAAEAAAGKITFSINNAGNKVTEFYLYGTGDRIMGEVENIGPGLTRQLIVEVPDGGTYTTACKPGMVGDGIRAPFTSTPSSPRRPRATSATSARRSRRSYPRRRSSSTP